VARTFIFLDGQNTRGQSRPSRWFCVVRCVHGLGTCCRTASDFGPVRMLGGPHELLKPFLCASWMMAWVIREYHGSGSVIRHAVAAPANQINIPAPRSMRPWGWDCFIPKHCVAGVQCAELSFANGRDPYLATTDNPECGAIVEVVWPRAKIDAHSARKRGPP